MHVCSLILTCTLQNPKYAGMDLVLAEDGLEIKAATIDKLIERLFLDAGMCCCLV